MAKVERAWQLLSRRFGLLVTNPVREMAEYVQPVIQAGSPDFTDSERPLYISGNVQGNTVGRFSSVGLVCTVACSISAITLETDAVPVRVSMFTEVTGQPGGYNPTVSSGRLFTGAAVTPGGQPVNRVARGNNAAAKVTTLDFLPTLSVPTQFANLIMPAGSELWVQAAANDTDMRANFFWREFDFGG